MSDHLTPGRWTAKQRLEWLDDQFCKQLAACSPSQREIWKRHVEAVRAGIDAINELDATRSDLDEARKDTARLDFLRTNGFVGGSCMHLQCFLPERFKSAESFRDAIDGEMESNAAIAKDGDK